MPIYQLPGFSHELESRLQPVLDSSQVQELQNRVITIGNFDGVHRGHFAILNHTKQLAQKLNRKPLAVTFNPLPALLLRPEMVHEMLLTTEERLRLLEEQMDVLVISTTTDFLAMEPTGFLEDLLKRQLKVSGIVEGPEFRFGHHRAGDVKLLSRWAGENQVPFELAESLLEEGEKLSSSNIRKAIRQGEVKKAASWLGRNYTLTGTVIEGAKRGRLLGFPTANLGGCGTMIPGEGVYAIRTTFEGKVYNGACNVGPNPTFGEQAKKVEAHLISFSHDIYGQELTIEFIDRIRDLKKFDSVEALTNQVSQDVERAKRMTTSLEQRVRDAFTKLAPSFALQGVELGIAQVEPDGIVQVYLKGACQACPSSAMSLISGIEQQVREEVPEVAYLEMIPAP